MSTDPRYLAAAIRLARRHEGLTGTNPSVACVLVRDEGHGPVVVGSGVTAIGGRPHAEPLAIAEAGERARGATAYVTLEPCAHHGRTPPCAETLIDAGIARVVTAHTDPDARVSGRGHAMLRAAGIDVEAGLLGEEAAEGLSAYLIQKASKRAQVTLKLAVSADGYIGARGEGQVPVTGPVARAQSHLLRAGHHAILVGVATALEDDPMLTCRLPGLEARSPARIVLDPGGRMPLDAKLVGTANRHRTILVTGGSIASDRRAALTAAGCELMPCEIANGRIALPELLEDLAAIGIHALLVEGGAATARAFLEEGLVDRLVLFSGDRAIARPGAEMIASPLDAAMLEGFTPCETLTLGEDTMTRYTKREG
ncbi:MAG: bifunctional diaminohydroxyphosphoribosylaminopyrimidine deaminase/5-amino-6-(5-phosphoribosylamino)uracil reductase RibD [Nitratireductor sp.]|nr:bifunctional diaminohydroxyphosphoribosylaminopyrimidine deaminase/5-amino-6-(5-phosphoribosylamino)uracil reductase RibD [Nitratireductor sp.]